MKKSLLMTFGICAAVFGVSCSKQSTPVERLDIDCSELASCIGTDFDAFVKANEKYQDEIDAEEGTVSFNEDTSSPLIGFSRRVHMTWN